MSKIMKEILREDALKQEELEGFDQDSASMISN